MNPANPLSSPADLTLDMRGAQCPWPVLKARKRLETMVEGAVLTLLATDPMAQVDVPHFCGEAGHQLLEAVAQEGVWQFKIMRGLDLARPG